MVLTHILSQNSDTWAEQVEAAEKASAAVENDDDGKFILRVHGMFH